MPSGTLSSLYGAFTAGKYSDLTLRCEHQEFKVHKVVVCSQSDVLAAAVDGSFKEALSNEIKVEFSADVVQCLVDYFYTQDYTVSSNSTEEVHATEAPNGRDDEPKVSQDMAGLSVDDGSWDSVQVHESNVVPDVVSSPTTAKDCQEDSSEELIQHVQVNAIADYYNVEGLKELSREKLKGDQKLHDELAKFTAENIEDLLQVGLDVPEVLNGFAMSLVGFMDANRKEERGIFEAALSASQRELDEANMSIEDLRDRLAEAGRRVEESKSRFERLEETLDGIGKCSACRNQNCPAEFNCTMERAYSDFEPPYFLRCKRCRCKQ